MRGGIWRRMNEEDGVLGIRVIDININIKSKDNFNGGEQSNLTTYLSLTEKEGRIGRLYTHIFQSGDITNAGRQASPVNFVV